MRHKSNINDSKMGMQLTLTSVCGPSRRLLDGNKVRTVSTLILKLPELVTPVLGEVVNDDKTIHLVSLHQSSGGSRMADPHHA